MTRRELLAMLPAALVACRRADALPATCADEGSLAQADVATRATLGYTDASPFEDKSCAGCHHFVLADQSGACGTCSLLKGPIHPRGYCKAFAPNG